MTIRCRFCQGRRTLLVWSGWRGLITANSNAQHVPFFHCSQFEMKVVHFVQDHSAPKFSFEAINDKNQTKTCKIWPGSNFFSSVRCCIINLLALQYLRLKKYRCCIKLLLDTRFCQEWFCALCQHVK